MKNIFENKTKKTEERIEAYMDLISNASLIFHEGVKEYLHNKMERMEDRCEEAIEVERQADELITEIKYTLYAYMLLPDSRADVFELLNDMDDIADTVKQVLLQLHIEKPGVPDFLVTNFQEMSEASMYAVDELVKSARCFFRETPTLNDHINKVYFYEKEADKLEEKIKRKTFQSEDIPELCHKMHLRYFSEKIVVLSDKAESIAQNLLVYSAKRAI